MTVDGVTVFDSEIAFRLRGPLTGGAWVTIKNAVVHDVLTAYRYEDNIQNLRIWNNTVGANVTQAFQAASSVSTGLEVRNLLTLGTNSPEAAHPSNLAVGASAFTNAAARRLHVVPDVAGHRRGRRAVGGHHRPHRRHPPPARRSRCRRVRAPLVNHADGHPGQPGGATRDRPQVTVNMSG